MGWPGSVAGLTAGQQDQLDQQLRRQRTLPIYLSDEELSRYYQGFANGVLWPLFHYLLDKVALESHDFDVYRSVNARFADMVAEHYQPGDLVWIHDYHLMLLPALLRERIPNARIGFFLHIPFPSSEVFRILPWRAEILEGLLGADLIGFHTLTYMRHFGSALLRTLGLESQIDRLTYNTREVRLGAFPMGVDSEGISAIAEDAKTHAAVEAIRKEANGRKILLGVDRLDYTKGLPRRLLAFEHLLERRPALRETVRLVQVAVPSREGIGPYENLRRQVDEMLGHINGRFGTAGSVPVHHLYRSFNLEELVAMYRAADVMLVTPLRDGMNLVAKEFCASHTDEDGVLILSEFAGAAAELGNAIRVNPYDIEQLSRTCEQALDMGREERRTRMRALRQRVAEADVHQWVHSFLDTLDKLEETTVVKRHGSTPKPALDAIVAELSAADHLHLFLDYDGTLMPFVSSPELAIPDADLSDLLECLVARPRTSVHILSGRRREDLDRWLGHLPLGLYAEHGLWIRPPGQEWALLAKVLTEWKDKVRTIMHGFVRRVPGSFIEDKTASVVWHYREADPEFAAHQARELRMDLMGVLSNVPAEVLQGDRIIEVRVHGVHKGSIVQRILAEKPGGATVALGDDRTDEDMFAALPPEAYAIHVGRQPSRACYCLANTRAVRVFLRQLLAEKHAQTPPLTRPYRPPLAVPGFSIRRGVSAGGKR